MNARDRTAVHLRRLQQLAVASLALSTSCRDKGYSVVDPLPESYGDPCDDADALAATTAVWSASATVLVAIDAAPAAGAEPVVSGGTILSSSVDETVWSGEIQPDTGSVELRLDFSLPCADGSTAIRSVFLDLSGTPVEGASLPESA